MAPTQPANPVEKNYRLMDGVEVPPLRNFHEFLLETDRYERPSFNDFKRWNNRIISNLLYFQTNYFISFIALFLIQSLYNSQEVFIGLIAIFIAIATLLFAISAEPNLKRLRSDHPFVTLGGIIIVAYSFISVFPSVCVVIFAFLLSILLVLIHASLRLRGIANRAANLTERFGIRTSLMGLILERTGLSVQV